MILHQPEIISKDGHTIVWAKLELHAQPENFPEFLWYRVPRKYTEFLSLQSDPFLIPTIIAGMYFGENIEVRGSVSPRLVYHLAEYQSIRRMRKPFNLHQVDIKYDQISSLDVNPKGVGAAFSGGVDSLFTLWKHLPRNQMHPNFHISHALFIDGFDIFISNPTKYQNQFNKFQTVLKKENIELIPVETNLVRLIVPRMEYVHFYGPILGGSAHLLGGLFKKFFISSSRDYAHMQTGGFSSNPTADPFLSTDLLEIIHFGSAYQRVQKVEQISDWEVAQDILRVCPNLTFPEEMLNCSRCEKCVRTMIPLYSMGKMSKFKTFAKPISKNSDGLWWARKFNPAPGFDYISEMFPFVSKFKPDFLPWLRAAALLGYLRFWLLKIIPKFIKTWLQRFGYFVDPLEATNAFENPEVVQLINSNCSRP